MRSSERNANFIQVATFELRRSPAFLSSALRSGSPELWRKGAKRERHFCSRPGKPQAKTREKWDLLRDEENLSGRSGGGREPRLQHSPGEWLIPDISVAPASVTGAAVGLRRRRRSARSTSISQSSMTPRLVGRPTSRRSSSHRPIRQHAGQTKPAGSVLARSTRLNPKR